MQLTLFVSNFKMMTTIEGYRILTDNPEFSICGKICWELKIQDFVELLTARILRKKFNVQNTQISQIIIQNLPRSRNHSIKPTKSQLLMKTENREIRVSNTAIEDIPIVWIIEFIMTGISIYRIWAKIWVLLLECKREFYNADFISSKCRCNFLFQ